jgi:hypothetical protein
MLMMTVSNTVSSNNPQLAPATKRRPVVSIDPARIVSRDRLRKLRLDAVDVLAESIKAQGLLQPIIVQRRGADFILIAGRHRLQAVRKLKHDSIRAEIADGFDADQVLLAEIDENLVRADLTPAERALHISKRKELYEAAHPETKHGGDRRSVGSSSQNENLKAFVADTAAKTGKGRSTVARDATRAKKVPVLAEIAGTCLDKGSEIDALAELPEADQRELADRAKAGEEVTARHDTHEAPLAEQRNGRIDDPLIQFRAWNIVLYRDVVLAPELEIPPDLTAEMAAELAGMIDEVIEKLRKLKAGLAAHAAPVTNAPIAGSDYSIPDDLSIPHGLKRGGDAP